MSQKMKIKSRIYILHNLLLIFFILFSISCSDSFDEIITKETGQKTGTGEIEPPGNEDTTQWANLTNVATPRSGASMLVLGEWLYIYGGKDYFGVRGDFWRYNTNTEETEILQADIPRAYHTMTVSGNRLYIFGGVDENGLDIRALKYYDTISRTWSNEITTSDTNGPFPEARHGHSAVAYNGMIYLFGGDNAGSDIDGGLIRFEIQLNTRPRWTNLDPGPAVSGHGAAVLASGMYVFGGCNPVSGEDENELWQYSFTNGTWARIDAPQGISPREGTRLDALDGELYIFCGNSDTEVFGDSWVLVPSLMNIPVPQVLSARSYSSSAALSDRIIYFGGYNSVLDKYYSDIWIYIPE